MKIHLHQIGQAGKHIEGEEPCPFPELSYAAPCVGPMRYALDVGISSGGLWANGSISQDVELECVACLTKFVYRIEVPNFAAHLELGGPETVDLTPQAREELLLNLPAHPHCDQHGGRVCKPPALPVESQELREAAKQKREAAWGVLDKLKLKKN